MFDSTGVVATLNLDVNDLDFKAAVGELSKDGEYALYCRSGNRSASPVPILVTGPAPVVATPIAFGSTWHYRGDGVDQGTAWRVDGFDDSSWASGAGTFGWGAGTEATVINGAPLTSYYRTTLPIASLTGVKARIAGIVPREYTRMGVAIRHLAKRLNEVEAKTNGQAITPLVSAIPSLLFLLILVRAPTAVVATILGSVALL